MTVRHVVTQSAYQMGQAWGRQGASVDELNEDQPGALCDPEFLAGYLVGRRDGSAASNQEKMNMTKVPLYKIVEDKFEPSQVAFDEGLYDFWDIQHERIYADEAKDIKPSERDIMRFIAQMQWTE